MKPKRPAANTESLSPALRRYLYATAAVTGAAIMIVEILGAKMLAPYVGTSHFVWTAQIAVTLVALAAGYYLGGRLVDRSPRLGHVYWAILWAAIYLDFAVAAVEPVAYRCLDFKLALGSLLASAFLFFTPLALLAMAGPFFVRVLTASVSNMGGNMGRLTAISTLGSFAGTILIGYVLIPHSPNSVTMYLTAGVLMAAAGGYFLVWGRKRTPRAAVVTAVAFGLLAGGFGVAQDRKLPGEVYRANSNFGKLQVLSELNDTRRLYLNDFLEQDGYDPVAKQSTDAFTYMLHDLAHGYATNLQDVLCIGLGVGIVPMEFAHEGLRVDVVEINPAVVPLAQKYFDLDPALLHLTIDDGRHFLNRCTNRYDAVVLDAFLGDSSPSHLLSREAFTAVRHVLKPGGVLVINCFGYLDEGKDFFAASVDQTLAKVFHEVRLHGMGGGNMYFAASDSEMKFSGWPSLDKVHAECSGIVDDSRQSTWQTNPKDGLVLTDDYNPVEYYDATNRETIRRALALRMEPR